MINNFALLIATYIPASLIIGSAAASGIEIAHIHLKARPALRRILAGIALTALLVIGLREALSAIQTEKSPYVIVTRPDLQAADWIRHTLPSKTKFAVNSFSAFTGTSVAGSDDPRSAK